MINYDSILSAFDGKPTLLQWLKLVKKALDESVLKDITLKQDGANVTFTFNFEDGTSLSTPAVTLPKGDTGAKGDKGDKGDTGAKGDKGDKGEQGVSVISVDEVSNEVVGNQTHTTLRFNFSNGTNNEVVVYAENGKGASGGKYYLHNLSIYVPESSQAQLKIINTDSSKITSVTAQLLEKMISGLAASSFPPVFSSIRTIRLSNDNKLSVETYSAYPFDVTHTNNAEIDLSQARITDNQIEL